MDVQNADLSKMLYRVTSLVEKSIQRAHGQNIVGASLNSSDAGSSPAASAETSTLKDEVTKAPAPLEVVATTGPNRTAMAQYQAERLAQASAALASLQEAQQRAQERTEKLGFQVSGPLGSESYIPPGGFDAVATDASEFFSVPIVGNIDLGGGNDILNALRANFVQAGDGDDTINVGTLLGGADLGSGDDVLNAAIAGQSVFGGAGNDLINITQARNILAGSGNDVVTTGFAEVVDGGTGDDVISSAASLIRGGSGNDVLTLVTGDSFRADGGAGDDVIILTELWEQEVVINRGSGNDTIRATQGYVQEKTIPEYALYDDGRYDLTGRVVTVSTNLTLSRDTEDEFEVTRENQDLLIRFDGGDSVRLKDFSQTDFVDLSFGAPNSANAETTLRIYGSGSLVKLDETPTLVNLLA